MAKLVTSSKRSSKYFIVNTIDDNSFESEETGDLQKNEGNLSQNGRIKKKADSILQNAAKNAMAKVQEAHEKARLIIQGVENEADTFRKRAFAEGYSEGLKTGKKEGLQEIEKQFESFLSELKNIINQALEERKRIIKELEPQVVDLSLQIAEKVLRKEASSYEDMIFNQISSALSKLNDRARVTLRVNKVDIGRLNSYRDRLFTLQDDIKELDIIEDLRVEAGGCIIESASGTVDARISAQLSEIGRNFSNIMES